MSIPKSLMAALFCFFFVFVVLAILFGLIKLFSYILSNFSATKKKSSHTSNTSAHSESEASKNFTITSQDGATGGDFSAGELKLINVDDQTAAMIMAIVSDESGIPLSELCFKSIRALD